MASMIYGVSKNGKKGLGCIETRKPDEHQKVKSKPLYKHFMPVGTELDCSAQTQKHAQTRIKNSVLKPKYHAQISLDYPAAKKPKVVKNSRRTNKRGPITWIPKDKIIYVVDILSSSIETSVMVNEQWILMTYDGQKVYVPIFGT